MWDGNMCGFRFAAMYRVEREPMWDGNYTRDDLL
mgnify:CR=1 FL=1